jgi:hypothetical protein
MNRLFLATALTALAVTTTLPACAEDGKPDPATVSGFNQRMFAGPIGKKKAYACFIRRYDVDHLARHPLQKVSTMKLLATAETQPGDEAATYSFRLGVSYRDRKGDFDTSGDCAHVFDEATGKEVRLACAVDCDGGGIGIALSKDAKSTIIRLERVRMWDNNKPDDEAAASLVAGADDKIFRLDRTDVNDCASLFADRKELAAIRHK